MLDSHGRIQKKSGTIRPRRLAVSDFFIGEVIEIKGLKFVVTAMDKRNQAMTVKVDKK